MQAAKTLCKLVKPIFYFKEKSRNTRDVYKNTSGSGRCRLNYFCPVQGSWLIVLILVLIFVITAQGTEIFLITYFLNKNTEIGSSKGRIVFSPVRLVPKWGRYLGRQEIQAIEGRQVCYAIAAGVIKWEQRMGSSELRRAKLLNVNVVQLEMWIDGGRP